MQDLFIGTWTLATDQSKFDPNHRPRQATLAFTLDADGHYLMTAVGINANGDSVVERPTRFVIDGARYPIPDLPGLAFVATRPNPLTIHGEARREDGDIVGGATYVVSEDGRTLIATNFGFDSQLRRFAQKTVWMKIDQPAAV